MSLFKRNGVSVLAGLAATGLTAAAITGAVHAATKPAVKQVVTGPVAVYWMNTSTSSGMTLGGMGGGGKPSLSSIMGAMGGGSNVSHSLTMELGSSQAASGEPSADHLPPAGLNVGNDLPLYWKETVVKETPTQPTEETHEDYQPPKGKILIFWGCGEHAPKNQPVVIDLAKITDPAERMKMMKQMMPATGMTLDSVHPPQPHDWKSYGEWPNKKSSKGLGGDSSLVGAHTVKGNYSPQIDFTLSQSQDFLPPIQVTGNAKGPSGAVPLTWQPMARSKGFMATAIGGAQDVVVMWTSSAVQTAMMGFAPQYLTANDIDRLQAQKILLPGDATGCTVPAEVTGAAQGLIYGITAYGGDTNMAYPPRPEDPAKPWNIQWETKVRYRSSTGGILGQSMGMMGGREENGSSSSPQGDQQKKKKGFGIGDMIKQGAGMIGGG